LRSPGRMTLTSALPIAAWAHEEAKFKREITTQSRRTQALPRCGGLQESIGDKDYHTGGKDS
jgi:hypothetical protein